jgi:hypothetical protein
MELILVFIPTLPTVAVAVEEERLARVVAQAAVAVLVLFKPHLQIMLAVVEFPTKAIMVEVVLLQLLVIWQVAVAVAQEQ